MKPPNRGEPGADPAGPDALVGREISHFRILARLGAGGMGVVYKAKDLRLQRTVALKVLPSHLLPEGERLERFTREAQAASALNHPGIVTVYEAGRAEDIDYIAMEHVEGRSLDQVIGHTPLDVRRALAYAIEIADALARAHESGIVHRDLKPRNVMVTAEGRIKILDFGLAKRLPGTAIDEDLTTEAMALRTASGTVLGTPHYMSPEQARGAPVDHRSDVFSFGVLLYEMLAGRRPFEGPTAATVLSAVLRDPPAPLRTLRPEVPEALERLLVRMLDKEPARRCERTSEVGNALRELLRGLEYLPSAPTPTPSAGGERAGSAGSPSWRRPLVLASLAAIILVATLLAWRLRPREAAPTSASGFRLLSDFPGSHRSPSLSPDGRMLAFVNAEEAVPQVWVRPLQGGAPVRITSGEHAAARPRWSPRGDLVVFERRGEGLWAVPPLGGTPRQIVSAGHCPAFFPDGDRLVFDRGRELWTVRLDGSEARAVPGVPVNYFAFYLSRCAAVSPDGKWLAYFQPENGPKGFIEVIAAEGGAPRRVTPEMGEAGHPVWTPDGRAIVYSAARLGSRTLWQVPATGGSPTSLTSGAGEDIEPDISRDGKRLVYANVRHSYAVTILDPGTGRTREIHESRRHLNGAVFSPDGRKVAFFQFTDEDEHIFLIEADGQNLVQLTAGAGQNNIMPRFSSDGRSLYHFQFQPTPSLLRIPITGGPAETIAPGWVWFQNNHPAPDHVNRRLVYSRFEGNELKATRVRDLATGVEAELPLPLWTPRFSPDDRHVVGSTLDACIAVCPLPEGDCVRLEQGTSPAWSHDGSQLYFARTRRMLDDPELASREVWVMTREGKAACRIAVLEPVHALTTPFEVSPEGEVLWVQFRRGRHELWGAELDLEQP